MTRGFMRFPEISSSTRSWAAGSRR